MKKKNSLRAALLELKTRSGVQVSLKGGEGPGSGGVSLSAIGQQGPRDVARGQIRQGGSRGGGAQRAVEGLQQGYGFVAGGQALRGLGTRHGVSHGSAGS